MLTFAIRAIFRELGQSLQRSLRICRDLSEFAEICENSRRRQVMFDTKRRLEDENQGDFTALIYPLLVW